MDWPMSDEIADRIEKTLPPELREQEEGPDGEPTGKPELPPEVQQQMQQMEKALNDLMGQLDQAKSGIEKARIAADAQIQVAKINAENRSDVAELKGVISMLVQRMQPPPELATEVAEDLQEGGEGSEPMEHDDFRPDAGPALDDGAPGDDLPLGQYSGPEIAQ